MKTNITLFLFSIFLCGHAAGAVLGKSDDELKADASHIITGEVIEVESEVSGKKNYRDRIYTIKVRVESAEKGEGIKKGDEVVLTAWAIVKRPEGWAGPQGFDSIPDKGDTITAFCEREGEVLKPFHPNGIKLKK